MMALKVSHLVVRSPNWPAGVGTQANLWNKNKVPWLAMGEKWLCEGLFHIVKISYILKITGC